MSLFPAVVAFLLVLMLVVGSTALVLTALMLSLVAPELDDRRRSERKDTGHAGVLWRIRGRWKTEGPA
jgi:hypothetical protein